ncbi:LexA family protein [Streptomyces millisiae]|uniref:Helix-turn-helix domain-containing protein n=1 Tax=Streptomyces millisiae TaxID=3075542 RepID=A0ABU2LYL2_9ACTN|nr:helix-turn-helix domain-containing protein [Streptomyces sp. DSM 44918]MDT0322093.1 helix-turn-helix domain-containing protein [Streptomyces sp. DSM 44918]
MSIDRQARILHTIRSAIADRGEAPTIREIARTVALSSPATVHHHLRDMERQGVICRSGQGRSLRYLPRR